MGNKEAIDKGSELYSYNILAISTDVKSLNVLNSINIVKLSNDLNINFHLVDKINNLQDKLNQLKNTNQDPNVIIAGRKTIAEGFQIHKISLEKGQRLDDEAYTYLARSEVTKRPDTSAKMLLPDGTEAINNLSALIQALFRVDSVSARDENKALNGSDILPLRFAVYGFSANLNKISKSTVFQDTLTFLEEKETIDFSTIQEFREKPKTIFDYNNLLPAFSNSATVPISVKKVCELVEDFAQSFEKDPNTSMSAIDNFCDIYRKIDATNNSDLIVDILEEDVKEIKKEAVAEVLPSQKSLTL